MIKKIIAVFFLTIFISGGVLYWGIYLPKNKSDLEISFSVSSGESFIDIANRLKERSIIKSNYFFIIYGALTQEGRSLMPGIYNLSSSMSIQEILNKLSSGGKDRITIIEGWNLRDVAVFLENKGYGTQEEFFSLTGEPPKYKDGEVVSQKEGEMVVKKGMSLEGFLFPDTYFVSLGTPMEEIVQIFLDNFESKIDEEIEELMKNKGLTLFETITIASLLEKEVRTLEDKKIVSGIIRNRMEIGMRLQLDATISYLTGRRSVQIPVTETRINSLYNTYRYEGLPPGPISNPGMESIKAALLPTETDYLYYLSKSDGETVFSKTHEEHVEAKNKYLRQ